MKKYFLFALLAMFIVGCDGPNANYPSGGDSDDDGGGSNKSYVVTGEAKDVTHKSVTLYGEVNVEIADYETIEWGVMYSADKAELESHLGTKVWAEGTLEEDVYSVSVTGLESETQYYYCAFVFLNEKQYKYGSVKSFTTLAAPMIDGIGVFSVYYYKQVTFSPGNLQYHPVNNKWRFAENQTDYIGSENSNCSSTYNGWLDLFGWSTNATNFGVNTSTDWGNYYLGSFIDWGTNKIGNDAPNSWRTLTDNEWSYLRNTRINATDLCGVAQVNGVNGLILLPDNWTCPSDVTFKSGFTGYGIDYYAAHQTFTAAEWSKLESAGAVFLPAAGYRIGSNVDDVQDYGIYWSTTEINGDCAYTLQFRSGSGVVYMDATPHYYGLSVRLVKDL